jgi:hypothetical protein
VNKFKIEKLSNYAKDQDMKRKQFTTTIKEDLLKDIKKLAIDHDVAVNVLLEEGIEWLLSKYKEQQGVDFQQRNK